MSFFPWKGQNSNVMEKEHAQNNASALCNPLFATVSNCCLNTFVVKFSLLSNRRVAVFELIEIAKSLSFNVEKCFFLSPSIILDLLSINSSWLKCLVGVQVIIVGSIISAISRRFAHELFSKLNVTWVIV